MEFKGWCQTRRGRFRSGIGSSPMSASRRLPLDVKVLADRIVVTASMPNVRPDDVALRISGRQLTIATTRAPVGRAAAKAAGTYSKSWYRQVRLPRPTLPDRSQVRMDAGVLTVVLPRADVGGILASLPGGESLDRTEIPLRSSADVMPPSPGPHVNVYHP